MPASDAASAPTGPEAEAACGRAENSGRVSLGDGHTPTSADAGTGCGPRGLGDLGDDPSRALLRLAQGYVRHFRFSALSVDTQREVVP